MLRLFPVARLLRAPLRCWVLPKAHVSAKPARTPTSPVEQAVGISVLFVSLLAPAGWVLTHLESYKKGSKE
ncbi:cytochrome c oxidase subunit 8B, mitochondrial-like [Ochotona princeps]|uniref:cytochrome c oxidase subunit 8B, mitochondrial-like n=1 Tax=Ochotona princeps TaxID=9978 RepID=UPI00032ADF3E|nr:cytochrome c oxidase subunit 8B, mitochondrial-like [Ochotona princeps]XP_058515567.1 cytochrome c oxidase subunit 8B, mitochondrial-like [Ochotona princeps]